MDKLTILFPSDYFNNELVDDDLKKEYESVMRTGLFNVILFSYNDSNILMAHHLLSVDRRERTLRRGITAYRIW